MDAEKTFRLYAKPEEAASLCKFATLEFACACDEAYKLGYRLFGLSDLHENEYFRQMQGLSCVYLLGFLSGSRAIRARNKVKNHLN